MYVTADLLVRQQQARLRAKLISYREARGLTQRQFAARARVSYRSIARIESGRHTTTLLTLAKLADTMGIAPAALLKSKL